MGNTNLTLTINGTVRTGYLGSSTVNVHRQLGKTGTCDFTLDVNDNSGYFPSPLDLVTVTESGYTFFAGFIDTVAAVLQDGHGNKFVYQVSCVDWMGICDQRVVFQHFLGNGLAPLSNVIQAVTDNFLDGEGIDWHTAVIPVMTVPELNYIGQTVTEVFNDLARISGCIWWIDVDKNLHFNVPNLSTHHSSLTTDDGRYRPGLKVTRNRGNYRNVEYVISDKPLYYSRDETVTATAGLGQTIFPTEFPIIGGQFGVRKPEIKVNGVLTPIKQLNVDPGAATDWYWSLDFKNVVSGGGAQAVGTVVEIFYCTDPLNVVLVKDDSKIAMLAGLNGLSGRIEVGVQVAGASVDDAVAIGSGEIDKYGEFPITIEFERDELPPDVGQLVSVTLPEFGVTAADMVVQQVTSQSIDGVNIGHGTSFRSTIQLTSGQEQQEAYVQWFQQFILRTKKGEPIVKYEVGTFALGIGVGATLVTGDNGCNPLIVKQTGPIGLVRAVALTAPSGDIFQCDILKANESPAVSIFAAGQYVEIPIGSTDLVEFDLSDLIGVLPETLTAGDVLVPNVIKPNGAGVTIAIQWAVGKGALG